MRLDRLGRRRSPAWRQAISYIEDRGQLLVLAGFLTALAAGEPALAWGFVVGGVAALLNFHQLAESVHRSSALKEADALRYLRHARRRRLQLALLALAGGGVLRMVDFRATVLGLVVTKVVLYFSAPPSLTSLRS